MRNKSLPTNEFRQDLHIRPAVTEEERDAVFRLRYRVFCEEYDDHRYADEMHGIWRDTMDGAGSVALMVVSRGADVVGTVRVTFRRRQPFIRDELYEFDKLAKRLGCSPEEAVDGAALFDRLAIDRHWRGQRLFERLVDASIGTARDQGCFVLLAVAAERNERMHKLFRINGWEEYLHQTRLASWPATHFYRLIRPLTEDRGEAV